MKYIKKEKRINLEVARNLLAVLLALGVITNASGLESKERSSRRETNTFYLSQTIDTYEFLRRCGVELGKLKSGEYYVKSYMKGNTQNIVVYSVEDFCEYLENKYSTFEDVLDTLNNNKNISDEFKSLIKDYIIKVKENNPNVSLSIFNYNLTNLKVECITKEKMSEVGSNIVARYDAKNNKILYLKGMSRKTFEHELSHMFTECYLYLDNTIIHKTLSLAIPIVEDNTITIKFSFSSILEGLTDYFTSSNNKFDYEFGSYSDFVSEVKSDLEIIDEDITTIFDKGIVFFLDALYDKKINSFDTFYELDNDFYNLINKEKKLTRKV